MNYKHIYELQWRYELRYKESTEEEKTDSSIWSRGEEKSGKITKEVILEESFKA